MGESLRRQGAPPPLGEWLVRLEPAKAKEGISDPCRLAHLVRQAQRVGGSSSSLGQALLAERRSLHLLEMHLRSAGPGAIANRGLVARGLQRPRDPVTTLDPHEADIPMPVEPVGQAQADGRVAVTQAPIERCPHVVDLGVEARQPLGLPMGV